MSDLRPPATGTEAYLEAILEELRVIRVALEGGGQVPEELLPSVGDPFTPSVPGVAEETFTLAEVQAVSGPALAKAAASPPTKRTRTRTRGAAT